MIITPLDKLSKMVLEELLDHLGLPYILVIALPVEQSSFEVISSFEKEHVLPLLKKFVTIVETNSGMWVDLNSEEPKS